MDQEILSVSTVQAKIYASTEGSIITKRSEAEHPNDDFKAEQKSKNILT